MLKSLVYALLALILLHLLAAGVFVGYLGMTDRLSRERLNKVVEIFKPTIAEHSQQIAQAKKQAKKKAATEQKALRLERAANGPKTLQQRLDENQRSDEQTAQRIQRLKREKQDILRQVAQAKTAVTKQRKKIQAAQKAFDQRVKEFKNQQEKKDFKQAVDLLKQLQPEQAKRVLQDMLDLGKEQTVIAYLAAMPNRKAGRILGQFQSPKEITQARQLIEGLRKRGDALADQPLPADQNKAPQPPQASQTNRQDTAA